jgi:hypothetical protein
LIIIFVLTPLASARGISEILNDGQGDFDPWNEIRWTAWYSEGKIVEPFEIDCSINFAKRATDWTPDLSELPLDGHLFQVIVNGDILINGNDIVIDVRKTAFRDRTLDQVLGGDESEWDNTQGIGKGFYFTNLPNDLSKKPNFIKNITMRGFQQGIKTRNSCTHPLIVQNCTFTRNEFGVYTNGSGVSVYQCWFLENGGAGIYSGNNSSDTHINGCTFRDNNITRKNFTYADINFDTGHHSIIENCNHLPTQTTINYFRSAISFYRNAGGGRRLRENIARYNIIRNNIIDGYDVGYNLGSRMGREAKVDISKEGRDYASYNLFSSNVIRNTKIGIKVNTPANTIKSNKFINVSCPIVLHCVFYSLTETIINDQAGDDISFWFNSSDYEDYMDLFPVQNDLNNFIAKSEKLIHVRSDYGIPIFPSSGDARFILAPTLIKKDAFTDIFNSGGKPIDIAVGDFDEGNSGDEFAVIWDQPISNIKGMDYYSIILYDKNGVEINRGGRSTTRYSHIEAGNFSNKPGEEIVAVKDKESTIYFFRRGYKDPFETKLMGGNPIKSIAAADFNPGGDGIDEIAYIEDDPEDQDIYFISAISDWTAISNTSNISESFHRIAAGNFDSELNNGDEVVAFVQNSGEGNLSYPLYFYKVGQQGFYDSTAAIGSHCWTAISGGDFNGNPKSDEVVVVGGVVDGVCEIRYFQPGQANPIKIAYVDSIGVEVLAICSGKFIVDKNPSDYEKVEGFSSSNYSDEISRWGDQVMVLPSLAPINSIPILIISNESGESNKKYLRITPLVR